MKRRRKGGRKQKGFTRKSIGGNSNPVVVLGARLSNISDLKNSRGGVRPVTRKWKGKGRSSSGEDNPERRPEKEKPRHHRIFEQGGCGSGLEASVKAHITQQTKTRERDDPQQKE